MQMNINKYISIFFISLFILPLFVQAQVNTVELGKNRIQHKKFKWKFYQKFALFSKIRKTHLNQLDINGTTILHFDNEHKLIDGFVIRRLNFYRKRKTQLIDNQNTISQTKETYFHIMEYLFSYGKKTSQ